MFSETDSVLPSVRSHTSSSNAAHAAGRQTPQPPAKLEVRPGVGVGAFRLGTPLRSVTRMIADAHTTYGDVDVLNYDWRAGPAAPHGVVMRLPKLRLTLTFHARTQLLVAVMFTEPLAAGERRSAELWYRDTLLCGAGAPATFVRLYDLLGPTLAGTLRPSGEYVLSYPGLDIVFIVPPEFRAQYADGGHPVTYPNGHTPLAERIVVREDTGAAPGSALPTADGAPPPLLPAGVPLARPWADVVVRWGRGVCVDGRPIDLGMVPQDVVSELGTAAHIFPKLDRRMSIHAKSLGPAQSWTDDGGAFMLCYPLFGLDLVFSAATSALTKIKLHNAVPPSDACLHYHRAWYRIPVFRDGEADTVAGWVAESPQAITAAMRRSASLSEADVAVPKKPTAGRPVATIDHATDWASLEARVTEAGHTVPKPLLATRETGVLRIVAFNGIVFTVAEGSGAITAVELFAPTRTTAVRVAEGSAVTEGHQVPPPQLYAPQVNHGPRTVPAADDDDFDVIDAPEPVEPPQPHGTLAAGRSATSSALASPDPPGAWDVDSREPDSGHAQFYTPAHSDHVLHTDATQTDDAGDRSGIATSAIPAGSPMQQQFTTVFHGSRNDVALVADDTTDQQSVGDDSTEGGVQDDDEEAPAPPLPLSPAGHSHLSTSTTSRSSAPPAHAPHSSSSSSMQSADDDDDDDVDAGNTTGEALDSHASSTIPMPELPRSGEGALGAGLGLLPAAAVGAAPPVVSSPLDQLFAQPQRPGTIPGWGAVARAHVDPQPAAPAHAQPLPMDDDTTEQATTPEPEGHADDDEDYGEDFHTADDTAGSSSALVSPAPPPARPAGGKSTGLSPYMAAVSATSVSPMDGSLSDVPLHGIPTSDNDGDNDKTPRGQRGARPSPGTKPQAPPQPGPKKKAAPKKKGGKRR